MKTPQPPLEGAIQRFREKFPVEHYYCEDPWYSCPLAEGGSANDTIDQTKCNCYAKEKQKKIEAFISDELKVERAKGIKEALHLCAERLADEMPDCLDCSGHEDSARIVAEITMEDFGILPVARHGER